jgi:hypothetical protein
MIDNDNKVNTTAGATGEYTAEEFNNQRQELQNAVTGNGQALVALLGDDERQLAKTIAGGGDLRDVANGGRALIGETVRPLNAGGAITILLPIDTATEPLYNGCVVMFDINPPALYSVNMVTFDSDSNTVLGTETEVQLTTDNLSGGFRWDDTANFWRPFKSEVMGDIE